MAGVDEMRDLMSQLYDSFNTGDTAVWRAAVAEDVLGVGSDPDEWWEGRSAMLKAGEAQIAQMSAAKLEMRPGTPRIVEQGDVIWAVDRPTISMPDGTATAMRLTVIASRRGDHLEVNHFHLSVGVPNEEALGQDLPTS